MRDVDEPGDECGPGGAASPTPAAPPPGSPEPSALDAVLGEKHRVRHRERQCSQGSHCSKMLPAPGRRQPGPLGITGTRTGPACRGPARDPVSHLLADVSAPQMPDWTGQRPPSNPSRRPPATLGALPVLSERLSSLRRAETSPPCCSHRRVLLPTPHGPRGAQHKHSDAQGRGGRTDTPQSSD